MGLFLHHYERPSQFEIDVLAASWITVFTLRAIRIYDEKDQNLYFFITNETALAPRHADYHVVFYYWEDKGFTI